MPGRNIAGAFIHKWKQESADTNLNSIGITFGTVNGLSKTRTPNERKGSCDIGLQILLLLRITHLYEMGAIHNKLGRYRLKWSGRKSLLSSLWSNARSSCFMVNLIFLRRRAKQIKKEQKIPHHKALDIVAKDNGFSNWTHLIKSIPTKDKAE